MEPSMETGDMDMITFIFNHNTTRGHMPSCLRIWTAPIHGRCDEQVPVTHADRMYAILQTGGLAVDYHRYDEWGHLFPPQVHRKATERMFRWLHQSSGGKPVSRLVRPENE